MTADRRDDDASSGRDRRFALIAALAVIGLAVAIIAVFASWGSSPDPDVAETRLYELAPPDGAAVAPGDLARTVAVLERRLDGTGAIVREDGGRIAVDIPPMADPERVWSLVEPVGRVGIVPLGSTSVEDGATLHPDEFVELVTDDQISAEPFDGDAGTALLLRLDPPADGVFADFTRQHVSEYMAVTMDDIVLSAPAILEPIPGGEVVLSTDGGLADDDVDRLVRIINADPLPMPLRRANG